MSLLPILTEFFFLSSLKMISSLRTTDILLCFWTVVNQSFTACIVFESQVAILFLFINTDKFVDQQDIWKKGISKHRPKFFSVYRGQKMQKEWKQKWVCEYFEGLVFLSGVWFQSWL